MPGQLRLTLVQQRRASRLQMLRGMDLLQKLVEGEHLFSDGATGVLPQPFQRLDHPQAEGIEGLQRLLVLGRKPLMVSPGVTRPASGSGPAAAPDVPGENIVLQLVTLRQAQSGQTGLQVAKHILIEIAPVHRVQRGGDEGKQGLLQKVGFIRLKQGDVILGKHPLQLLPIRVHRPGRHHNVPVANPALPDQGPNLPGGPSHLLPGRGQLMDHYTTVPGAGIGGHGMGKKRLLQMAQGRGPLPFPGGQSFLLHRTAHLGSQPLDPSQSFPRRGKDRLLPSPLSIGQRQCHGVGLAEEFRQHQTLLGGKVGKPIQIHVLTLEKGKPPQLFRQTGQPVPGVQRAPGGHGLIGTKNQAQVSELLTVQSLGLLSHLGQLLPCDTVALQLVQGGQQTGQKGRLLGGHGIDRQIGLHRTKGGV